MSQGYSEDVMEWSFPSLDIDMGLNSALMQDMPAEEISENTTKNISAFIVEQENSASQVEPLTTQTVNPQPGVSIVSHPEVDILKKEYETKIAILNKMISNLENSSKIMENEVIEMIHLMIKKIAYRIIYKEIEIDPTIIITIIKELSELIQPKNKIISITLSTNDFKRLDIKDNNLAELIEVNDAFSQGDVVIKTDFTEVRAKLNDRIDQLMGDKYD